MNFWKKAACVAAACALFATGCSGDTTWVYAADGVTPPAGVYLLYMVNSLNSVDQALALEDPELDTYTLQYKDRLKLSAEGQAVPELMVAEAQKSLRQYIAVEQQFRERGLALGDDDMAAARTQTESYWTGYGEMYEKNGIARSSLQLQMEHLLKRERLFADIYGEGGERGVPLPTLRDRFAEDYTKVDMMVFYKAFSDETDEEGEVTATIDEQNAAIKAEAQEYLDRLEEGEEIEELVYRRDLQLAEEAGSETPVEKGEKGSSSIIVSEELKAYYGFTDEFVQGAAAIAVGECGLFEDEYFYYVARRLDILEDEEDFEQYRDAVLSSMKSEEFEELLAGWAGDLQVTVNEQAVQRYRPGKLKLD